MKILSSDDPICVEFIKSLDLKGCSKLVITMESKHMVKIEAELYAGKEPMEEWVTKLVKYKLVEIEDKEGELPRKDLFIPSWGKKELE